MLLKGHHAIASFYKVIRRNNKPFTAVFIGFHFELPCKKDDKVMAVYIKSCPICVFALPAISMAQWYTNARREGRRNLIMIHRKLRPHFQVGVFAGAVIPG